jgi:hypothetical protein
MGCEYTSGPPAFGTKTNEPSVLHRTSARCVLRELRFYGNLTAAVAVLPATTWTLTCLRPCSGWMNTTV